MLIFLMKLLYLISESTVNSGISDKKETTRWQQRNYTQFTVVSLGKTEVIC